MPPYDLTLLSAIVTALATIVLAILTGVYVRITGRMLDSQSNPLVIIFTAQSDMHGAFLDLVVQNIGVGVAHDIRFEFSKRLPIKVYGFEEGKEDELTYMERGPFADGIPALGPGERRRVLWGSFKALAKFIGDDPIIATCKFKRNGAEMTPTHCPLEVISFSHSFLGKSDLAKIAGSLFLIERHLAPKSSAIVTKSPEMRIAESLENIVEFLRAQSMGPKGKTEE